MQEVWGILRERYFYMPVIGLSPITRSIIFSQERYSNVGLGHPTAINEICRVTAVLHRQKPILRSLAKSNLSLCVCIIPHSGKIIQAIGKVSLFSRIGEIFLCLPMPP